MIEEILGCCCFLIKHLQIFTKPVQFQLTDLWLYAFVKNFMHYYIMSFQEGPFQQEKLLNLIK